MSAELPLPEHSDWAQKYLDAHPEPLLCCRHAKSSKVKASWLAEYKRTFSPVEPLCRKHANVTSGYIRLEPLG